MFFFYLRKAPKKRHETAWKKKAETPTENALGLLLFVKDVCVCVEIVRFKCIIKFMVLFVSLWIWLIVEEFF